MSDSRRMMSDMAHGLFADLFPIDALHRAETGEWPEQAWGRVVEMGLPNALLPEEAGGFGFDPQDALGLAWIAGYHAVPLPLVETMVAGSLLARSKLTVPDGPLSLIVAGEAAPLKLTVESDGGLRLRGSARRVPWGARAQALVVVTDCGRLALVRQGQWKARTVGRNLASEPRDDLDFDTILSSEDVEVPPAGFTAVHARALGAAMRCLTMAGALERVLALTVQYAGERVQFGRAIGKFQAVQQALAVLAGEVAAAGGAADLAAEAMVAAVPDLLIIGAAKLRAGEAASTATAIAHQVHGAIGFTREHLLHFLTMRLWSWRDEFGNEAEWARLVGRRTVAAGGGGLWPMITAA